MDQGSNSDTSPPTAARGHFNRFNALVENGWLARLKPRELQVWLVYEKHADKQGVAFPDGRTIADAIGHASDNHIGSARRALQQYGLIEVLDKGGGRDKRAHVRVLHPPINPPDSGAIPSENGSVSDAETLPIRELNPPDLGAKPSRFGNSLYKEEHPIEHPIEHPTPRAAHSRACVVDGDAVIEAIYHAYPMLKEPIDAKKEIRAALKRLRARPDAPPDGGWSEWLLGRTTAYAATRHEIAAADPSAKRFTPYPSRWFKKGRYEEDPATWAAVPGDNKSQSMTEKLRLRLAAKPEQENAS